MNLIIVFVCVVVVVVVVSRASASEVPWMLQRVENEESSRILFKNTTVTGKFMLASWSWRDSLAGTWDTSLRVSLANLDFHNGHLQYRDGYGKHILQVRWQQSPFVNLTWKAFFDDNVFPPNSWNMSSDFVNWGYRPFSERTWAFYVGEQVFEAKLGVVTIVTPLDGVLGLWTRRRKRSATFVADRTKRSSGFNLQDLFTGDGPLAQIPQLFINLFSMITNFIPMGRSDNYVSDAEFTHLHTSTSPPSSSSPPQLPPPTEPEAEMVTVTAEEPDMPLKRIAPNL